MNPAGFETIEGVLPAAECAELADLLAPSGARGAGSRHRMAHPRVSEVATRPELLEIARRWIGPGATPYRATLFDKSRSRNWLVVWHQDTALPLVSRSPSPEWGPWSVKEGVTYAHAPAWALEGLVALRIHLDPCTSGNGPLRVLAGSHRMGVLDDDAVFRISRDCPARECLAGRGGVTVMKPLLIHSSSKGGSDLRRRVLHLEYAPSLDLAPGLRLATA